MISLWSKLGAVRRARRAAFIFATLCVFAGASSARAADEGTKVGYVDVTRAASRSISISSKVAKAEEQLRVKQEELEIQLRVLKNETESFSARRSVMTEESARAEEKRLEAERDEIDLLRLEIEKLLRRTETEIMGPAVDRIIRTIQEVAKENGFDIILRNDVVLFGNEALDITPLVIEQLDK